MYKSYYFLNRYIIELREYLVGKTIKELYSQDKDKLILHLENGQEWFMEISVNPGKPFINLKNKYHRAKKNTLDFFSNIINASINDILIASDDRIVLITTSKGEIYFTIRGQFTNVFCVIDEEIESFKKEKEEVLLNIFNEFSNKEYLNHINLIDKKELKNKSIDEIRKELPFVGREISNEVKLLKNEKNSDGDLLCDVLKIIENEHPIVFFDENSGAYNIGFDKMVLSKGMQKEVFNNLNSALNSFLSKQYRYDQKAFKEKVIRSFLDRELIKITNKLNNLSAVLEKGSNDEEFSKFGNILLTNLNKLKSGAKEIELFDILDNNKEIKIKLNPKLSPNQNVKYYFDKARDSKTSFDKSTKLKTEAEKYFKKIKSIETKLINATSIAELDVIMSELKIKSAKTDNTKEDISSKFKQYLIENKYHVFVGKDSTNNDLLTTKFAKQNDFWFHARSVSGSHVVLRVENTKEAVPKNILKKVAALAAYHSKAKTSGLAPVSYTLKKYVIKRKGMPVGQVSLTKEQVLLVKPEIPSDCEYIAI